MKTQNKYTLILLALTGLAALASTVTAQSTLYWGGGTTTPSISVDDTAANTVNFTGTWDTTTTNWNPTTTDSGNYTTWVDGSVAFFKSLKNSNGGGPTISLAFNPTIGGMSLTYPSTSATNQAFVFNSTNSSNRTITVVENAVFYVANGSSGSLMKFDSKVILDGMSGFTLRGSSTSNWLEIGSASTISGNVVVNGGNLRIVGTLLNVESIYANTRNARLQPYGSGVTANKLSDTLAVELAGGQYSHQSDGNSGIYNETIGSIKIEGSGTFFTDPRDGQTQSVASTLTLANGLTRGDNGKGVVLFTGGNRTDAGLGTTTGFNLVGHGIAASQSFLPYAVVQGRNLKLADDSVVGDLNTTRFLATNASGELRSVDSIAGLINPTDWDTAGYTDTTDLHFDLSSNIANSNPLDANVEVRSIALGATGANRDVKFGLGGNTLKATAIASSVSTYQLPIEIGTNNSSRGVVTANGVAGGDIYFIHQKQSSAQSGTMIINAVIADNGGAVNAIFGGAESAITLNAANTYTGKTFINGNVTLASTGSLLETNEINIASGAILNTSAANRTIGGGSVVQKLAGGGGTGGLGSISLATSNIVAGNSTLTIGANGTLAPGDTGANEAMRINFTTAGTGKLIFAAGSTLAMDLGTKSDKIEFAQPTGEDWLSGSGNATLALTLGTGFDYGDTYTIFENVITPDFTFASITGYDTVNYTANFSLVGDNYVLSFTPTGGGADYASWATDNGIDGQPATGDFDNDGLSNLMEYAIDGRNPALPDGPIGSLIDGTVTFNKRAEAVSNGDLSYRIELSTDLGLTDDWTPVTANETLSTISWTFPGSEPSNFARLVVTQAP